MTGWAGANYAARLDLEENSLTRVKNVHIFNGTHIIIRKQPAQSPDTNCNDLGFYASIDATIKGRREFELGKLCKQVEKAWDDYPEEKLTKIFEMKKRVLEEIDSVDGGNEYELPHKSNSFTIDIPTFETPKK